MTLCELIGEEIFESRLISIEEESTEGKFTKISKLTNEYEPKGISRRWMDTKVYTATGVIVQECVEESDFEVDEYGSITLEKVSIDCGTLSAIERNQIKYNVVYGEGNRIEKKTRESNDKKTILRTFYMYNSDGSISSIIFDEVDAKGNTIRNVRNTKICDIIYDDDFGCASKIIVTKIDSKHISYEQGIYIFTYDINTGMLSKIHLQQPEGMRDCNSEEYVIMEDDFITVVSGLFADGMLKSKKVLKFKRY